MYRQLSCVLVLVVVLNGVAASSANSVAAPLFALANEQYFGHTVDQLSGASYRVYDDYKKTLHSIVRSALKADPDADAAEWLNLDVLQQHSPEAVLIVLGNQLKTSDLRSRAAQDLLQPLQSLLAKARSSFSAPYVLHQVDSSFEDFQLDTATAGTKAQTLVLGCSSSDQQDLSEALQHLSAEPAVVVVCTKVDDSIAGSPPGLAAELQQLQVAHTAVAALNKRQITVYASRPDVTGVVQQRRLLQAANDDVGTCGQLCQTQVKWLEGILAAFILAIAAFSGMCCLYMLDTPTRFEKPKEGTRTD